VDFHHKCLHTTVQFSQPHGSLLLENKSVLRGVGTGFVVPFTTFDGI